MFGINGTANRSKLSIFLNSGGNTSAVAKLLSFAKITDLRKHWGIAFAEVSCKNHPLCKDLCNVGFF